MFYILFMEDNNILGVVLAGGKSRRFGEDKNNIKLGNKTLLEHVLSKINNKFNETLIVSSHPLKIQTTKRITIIEDCFENFGPLAGVLSSMKWIKENKKLKKINSLQFTYAAEIPGAPAKLQMNVLQQLPNSFSMSMQMMGMTVQRQYSNGNGGFSDGMQGQSEMTPDELAEAQTQYKIAAELAYFDNYTAQVAGVDVLDDEEVYVVIRTDLNGEKATEYYSVNSKFLVKLESVVDTPQGAMPQSTLYKDYQDVKGYFFPHQTIQNVVGQSIDMKLNKVVVNNKIKATAFE